MPAAAFDPRFTPFSTDGGRAFGYRSAWLMKHKILEAMQLAEQERRLDGRVEIDDASLGGDFNGGSTGRGADNKVRFVAAVQTTAAGHPMYACL